MTHTDWLEIARRLALRHLEIEPSIVKVFVIQPYVHTTAWENVRPIRLLEVNAATVATGGIDSFAFAPTRDVPFPTFIAEITPDEFENFRRRPELLPPEWSLRDAEEVDRPGAP